MKKNLLFIIPGLGAGGGEKSLVNLLNQLDYSKYNVDLFLLNTEGLFMPFLPKEVNILTHSDNLKIFNNKLHKAIFKFLYKGNLKLAYCRTVFFLNNKFFKNKSLAEQYSWKYLKQAIGILDKEYDVAIGYLEKTSNYLCVDNVRANKKIGWIHNDYKKLNMNKQYDTNYFKKLDYLITVSDECKKVLEEEFPKEKRKVRLIHNIVSENTINKLANNTIEGNIFKKGYINIISIGRLTNQKGFDLAIEACKILVNKGYKIIWNVIGEGEDRKKLEELIKKNNLKNNFKLLGLKSNPYPYIKNCDIYAQPSRFEGKSVAIDEAKILRKPILVTNFSTVYDQIVSEENGLIVEMNSKNIALGLERLIKENLQQKLIKNLNSVHLGNEEEIYKLYKILA